MILNVNLNEASFDNWLKWKFMAPYRETGNSGQETKPEETKRVRVFMQIAIWFNYVSKQSTAAAWHGMVGIYGRFSDESIHLIVVNYVCLPIISICGTIATAPTFLYPARFSSEMLIWQIWWSIIQITMFAINSLRNCCKHKEACSRLQRVCWFILITSSRTAITLEGVHKNHRVKCDVCLSHMSPMSGLIL